MIYKEKCIVVDLDGTICHLREPGQSYAELKPRKDVVDRLKAYREQGYHVLIFTSRNMRTFEGNMGRILAETAPMTMAWLARHGVPYDEIHFGKPWAGKGGFYIDDRAIRPDEFVNLDISQIGGLVGRG